MEPAGRALIRPDHATGHFVRFYHSDGQLIDEVVEFASDALRRRGGVIVIATRPHLSLVVPRIAAFRATDEDTSPAIEGRFEAVDAEAALAEFMVDGWPDEGRFFATIGGLLAKVVSMTAANAPVHAYGEMVAVLCASGQYEAAVRLEQLWNELARRYSFTLFCAYPDDLFRDAERSGIFDRICRAHTHVLPSEVLEQATESDAFRLIAQWQQKAAALEAEIERRRRAEAVKDEFLAMLGHELRNPLSPIVTALQLIRMHPDPRISHELAIIQRQVDYLVGLVDDLLDVSRVIRGKIKLKKRTVRVADVLANAVEVASLLLEQRGHELVVDVEADLKWIVDAARIAQVVSNLLTNAARYTAERGKITLSASRESDDMIAVSVRDNGSGIPKEMLPHVFELFFQGKRSVDRAEGGLGLGLALVKSLVELHGGTVSARSDGPGSGSEFTIRLPGQPSRRDASREAGEPRAHEAVVVKRRAPRPRRVLLVDDNVDGVEALALLISECGHEVRAVYDPASALQVIHQFVPDIAIVDIGLPVMDGYQLIGRLRAALGPDRCRFAALTGYGQEADRNRSREVGFDDHFVKPVDPTSLLRFIDESPVPEA
ncbi:signal transduction histidine kinase [Trinickia symbiotica]|uniref:histidine kinase n=1 Tax=Trinickia symbiotica TaxID=863227 RepID=A0A2N7X1J1_9BURK|nr:ATP-binding protein [Trinickia symbiotica]PMS35355.1 histidine kinase [Trinickia symbiotica]PPK45365.1 signal transduction histidine kinase [Trinickia symbiotica]